MKKFVNYILSLNVLLIIISCQKKKNYIKEFTLHRNNSDTLLKDIPLSRNGSQTIFARFKYNYEKKLCLKTLENGFDSAQIRIWCNLVSRPPGYEYLIIFENNEGIWSGSILSYSALYNKLDHFSIDSLITFHSKKIQPKGGWKDFMDRIFSLQLLTLLDYNHISNYPSFTDPGVVTFEIATKHIYRFYSYEAPYDSKEKIKEAEYVTQILDLLEKEFGITLFEKY